MVAILKNNDIENVHLETKILHIKLGYERRGGLVGAKKR